VTLAALAATLGLYRAGRALSDIPVWQMIAADPAGLRIRAIRLAGELADDRVRVIELLATVGGGSLPGETLPSFGLSLRAGPADRVLARLRQGQPAVIGRIADGAVLLDLRTVAPSHDDRLRAALVEVLERARA
jgi:L-seryl-tRNA(Ser) seleniumtransferase